MGSTSWHGMRAPRPVRPTALVLLILLSLAPAGAAQPPAAAFPTATTIGALTRYPAFYHLKPVIVRGQLTVKDGQARLLPAGGVERGLDLLMRGDTPSDGPVEVRGQFWDVGRLSQDDPHAAAYNLAGLVQARLGDRWPAQGELLVMNVSSIAPAPPPAPKPSLRQLSLAPERFEGQAMTVVGQFGGRNVLGDLPQAPRISRTDFVLRHAGGAVWVSGVAPKGRGWQLRPDSKVDTDQWLQVEGTVRYGEGLVWIEAKSVAQAKAEAVAEPAEPPPPVLKAPPPEVVFSLPAQDETDVPPTTTVKLQTSRDLDPASFEKQILVTYLGQPPDAPPVPFKARFDRASRVLELQFEQPLERFRTVKVELLEGVRGTDGQAVKPFTLTFSIGG